jgi:hypothetical protein
MPQQVGIDPVATRKMQHAVIFGDDVQPTARPQHALQLGE